MATLYLDRKNLTLRADGDALVCYENDERMATVPLKVLQRVCIRGDITLSAKVLSKLGEAGVGVLILNGRQNRPALMLPNWKLDGKRRVAQYALSQDKVASLAAARYFSAWTIILPENWHFTGRNKRPPRDPLNATLSLAYTLLHFDIVKHLYLSGLDPFIGYYHQPEHGRESLACDLLEYLRSQCDVWVLSLFYQEILTPEDFSTTAQGCLMSKNARIKFYPAYEATAKQWRSHIHQLCANYLAILAQYSGQPEIQLSGFTTLE